MKRILFSPDANTEGSSSETFRTVSEMQTEPAPGEMGAESDSQQSNAEESTGSLNDFVSKQIGKELPKDNLDEDLSELERVEKQEKEKEEREKASRSKIEQDKKKGEREKEQEEEDEKSGKEKKSEEEEQQQEGDEEGNKDENGEQEKVKIPEEKLLQGKDPIPVDRFKEVITERNQARDRIRQMEVTVNDWNELDKYCKMNAITPQQFRDVVEIQALLNNDPVKALEKIRPIVNELEGFVGNKLPDDLQKAVDDGEISLRFAKEVAQSRAQKRFGEGKLKHDRQRMESERQAELNNRIKTSVMSWETSKRESDPDYKPKSDQSGPDGKWELVQKYIMAMANETDARGQFVNPITDENSMIAIMEKAYSAINNSTFTQVRKPATKKPLRSDGNGRGSETNGKRIEDQPTLEDAVHVGLRQFGHRV